MNMKNEEKIYQLNTYNIAEYTSTDYTDNDIAVILSPIAKALSSDNSL